MAKEKQVADTKQKEEDILADLTFQQESVKAVKKTEREESKKNWQRFQTWRDNPDDKLYTTKTYTAVWVSLSKFISVFGDMTKLFSISGRGTDESDRLTAKIKSAGLKYELDRIPNSKMAQILHLMQLAVEGWTVLKADWDDIRKGLAYPYIKNEDISFDPTAILTSDIKWIHQRQMMTRKELEEMAKDKTYSGIDEFLESAVAYRKDDLHIDNENPYLDNYAIYECWDKDRVKTVAGIQQGSDEDAVVFDTLLRDKPNPFNHKRMPFAFACFDPTGDNVKGYGIPQIAHSPQKELDAFRRLYLELSETSGKGVWSYDVKDSDYGSVVQDILTSGKPGAFSLNKADVINRLDTPPNQTLIQEIRMFLDDIDDACATHPPVSGATMPRKETLGAVKLQQAGGNERHAVRLEIFSDPLKDIGQMFLENLYQYHDKELEVKVFDGDDEVWKKVKFDSKEAGKFDLVLEVSPSAQTQAERQEKLLRMLEVFSKIPQLMKTKNIELLGKMLASAIDPKFEHQFNLPEKDIFMNALKEINDKNPEHLKFIVEAGEMIRESGLPMEQLKVMVNQLATQKQAGGEPQGEMPPVTQ